MSSVTRLLLLLLCGYHSVAARAGDDARSYKVLAVGSLEAEAVCAQPQATLSSSSGATVRLSHRYGPCSPAPSSEEPTITELLRGDQLRANYIQQKFSAGNNSTDGLQPTDLTVPITVGYGLNTRQYVIEVGLGSPVVVQNMIMDTLTDVSWVYCRSSAGSALFDPSQSTTYAPFTCSAPECTQLIARGKGGCANSECQYSLDYVSAPNNTGTYGSDTLTLTDSDALKSFQFGCRQDDGALSSKADGLMGLGGGAQSLVSQMAATYGQAFSYCFPPSNLTSGFLTLGAPPNGMAGFVSTPMLRWQTAPSFYGVLLQGIVVEGTPLNIPSTVFSDGSVMDSATIVTKLPAAAYAALSTSFKAAMTQYPPAPPRGTLDTCFDFTGLESITVPNIALVFDGGVVLDLDVSGILLANCLAFAAATTPAGIPSIIGNMQQRRFEVLIDPGQGVVGFRSGAC